MHFHGPVETTTFTLRTAAAETKVDCGFEPHAVAVGPEDETVWGALAFDDVGGSAAGPGVVGVRFWVAPERRGKRLAAAMLRAAAPSVFASGARRIEARPPVRAQAAIRAAMQAGFRPDGGVARAGAWDGTEALMLGLLPGDGPGPAPRTLPDLPGGTLDDGTIALRPLAPEDFEAHLRHRSDPEVYAGAALPLPPSREEAREVCEWRAAVDWLRGRSALMVIDDGAGYQGTIGLYDVAPIVGTGMIGYDLRPGARGRGYATRAVTLVRRWAFDEVGLGRVWAGTDVHNTASQAVLRRAGFRLEGVERGGLPTLAGRRRDTLLWASLNGG
ncbi:GNAT family N-acetyltransferase [Glycomyces sp. TRM65418]|uniref:GNAT family N-acetyltransferase n=1 Tax=Glycomyces sp. TRM65418 TaxID=2867006 RepID=UPI001CE4EADF|nr:GNAT family N-acetyltransferase [Glycomyces sp. TRM65418]MCC3762839.1 GNAT family N-acetyltransferase [Glycomyces sp. TRM65418]QZD56866.1 GNAT family N-acetyltransferase [Glycomyces sp. TRM65418]